MEQIRQEEILTLQIHGYGSDAQGVSQLADGKVVFVRGALSGERCRARLLNVGARAAWAEAVEILTPSPARIAADCPYYPACGGCQTRHMSYEAELAFKQERLQEALSRIGGADITVSRIHGAKEILRYRNKVQFPVSARSGELCIGFYRRRSHEVIDVADCLLQPEETAALRAAVRAWMERFSVPAYDERRHEGLIRHVFLRSNHRGETLCALVANATRLPHEAELIGMLRQAEPKLQGIVLSVNQKRTNVILGTAYRTLWGAAHLQERLCGLDFQLSVPSFFQVNRAQTELLYQRAAEFAALQRHETLLDLYCGIGTVTLRLAKDAKLAIGAEIVPEAVEDARRNARQNGVQNTRFLSGDAGQVAARLAEEGLRPDVITVDPPRKGLSPEVIDAIAAMAPSRLVYISCDPATLARDVKRFAQLGYVLKAAEAFDLFPRTVHVECVILMQRSGLKDKK